MNDPILAAILEAVRNGCVVTLRHHDDTRVVLVQMILGNLKHQHGMREKDILNVPGACARQITKTMHALIAERDGANERRRLGATT